jgi:hypothetical protein
MIGWSEALWVYVLALEMCRLDVLNVSYCMKEDELDFSMVT